MLGRPGNMEGEVQNVPQIKRLQVEVVNRIAAGEVIQKPANALKEMLENSLDAGATQITITVKEGGSRLLQISDNGHGIRADDLPLLCERHTTSKLTSFEQLEQGISTLGFRGEALASISYIAHVTVTTMTAGAEHGWRVEYKNGVMESSGPKPCASTKGTTITVEDMFYNVPLRRKALRTAHEEYNLILEVAGRYSIHHPGVGMTVKRQGETRPDLHTVVGARPEETIKQVIGCTVGKHLLPVFLTESSRDDDSFQCQLSGFVSGGDYNGMKKTMMVLFINGRLVECSPLRRALEMTYAATLPKANKPFMYLNITLPGHHVDVNLHPTKKEVGFLYQEDLIEAIRGAVEISLAGSNNSKTFTQTVLPGAPLISEPPCETQPSNYYRPDKLVRTDSRVQTLNAFLSQDEKALCAAKRVRSSLTKPQLLTNDFAHMPTAMEITKDALPMSQSFNRPVRFENNMQNNNRQMVANSLLSKAEQSSHAGLAEIIKSSTWVGIADEHKVLLQHGTRLYLMDVHNLTKDMFYQQMLQRLSCAPKITLSPPLSLRELTIVALEEEEEAGRWQDSEEEGTKVEVADLLTELLGRHSGILSKHFSLDIDRGSGELLSVPLLIESYVPSLVKLPLFLLKIAQNLEWSNEESLIQGVSEYLSEVYAVEMKEPSSETEWMLQHIILPALRAFLIPTKMRATDGSVVELTRLETLYRVFERC